MNGSALVPPSDADHLMQAGSLEEALTLAQRAVAGAAVCLSKAGRQCLYSWGRISCGLRSDAIRFMGKFRFLRLLDSPGWVPYRPIDQPHAISLLATTASAKAPSRLRNFRAAADRGGIGRDHYLRLVSIVKKRHARIHLPIRNSLRSVATRVWRRSVSISPAPRQRYRVSKS